MPEPTCPPHLWSGAEEDEEEGGGGVAVPPADTAAPPGLPLLLDAAKPGEEWRRGEEEGGRWREEGLEGEGERVEEEGEGAGERDTGGNRAPLRWRGGRGLGEQEGKEGRITLRGAN